MWANLHLLFWLSLFPFVTSWVGENQFAAIPVTLYGAVLLLAAFAYRLLVLALLGLHGNESLLATAIGDDKKGVLSLVIYLVAIALSFVSHWVAFGLYVLVAAIWLIPDMRIEKTLAH